MDSYDSEKRCILQWFSKYTNFAFLCTAPNSNFLKIFARIFSNFLIRTSQILQIFTVFGTDFDEIVSEFHRIFANCVFWRSKVEGRRWPLWKRFRPGEPKSPFSVYPEISQFVYEYIEGKKNEKRKALGIYLLVAKKKKSRCNALSGQTGDEHIKFEIKLFVYTSR